MRGSSRSRLETLERILASGAERDVPAVSLLEIDYARAVRRAERDWLHQALDDINHGRLRWSPVPSPSEETP